MNITRIFWLPLLVSAAHSGFAATSCESLKTLQLPATRVTLAESITPNPEWKYPPSVFNGAPIPGPRSTGVPFCRVGLVIEKQINVEVWLPRDWNGNFQGVGNGGLAGGINYLAMGTALAHGFATASTDTGHQTQGFFDTDWIPGHPQQVIDFGHRAHHLMAEAGKKVTTAYYGKPLTHAYYSGCSSGGWQGLTEAQKYPADYDGIVAGAPANNFVRLQAHGILTAQMALRDPQGNLSPGMGQLFVKAATAKCDAIDGVQDGVIDDPRKCNFDAAALQCKVGETANCLTPPQVIRAKALYGPATSAGGLRLYPGLAWGAPPVTVIPGLDPNSPQTPAIVLMLPTKPDWDTQTFDADRHIPMLEKQLDADLGATQTNLSAFRKHGGKLILYHGWADQLLSPYNTIDYYEGVRKTAGAAHADEFVRLFMEPGMAHCAGGPGPDAFDAVDAMVKWVEHGTAPEQIVASHSTAGQVDRTRPLCPYPKVAKYKGSGSTDAAASFVCAAPT